MVIVYSKPACAKCIAVKSYLNIHGIDHEILDISKDSSAMEAALSFGIKEMPIVVWDNEAWGGFNDVKMDAKRMKVAA